jgi:hypothetical protein
VRVRDEQRHVRLDLLTKNEEDTRGERLLSTLASVYILRIQDNLRDATGAYHLENYDK